MPELEIAYLLIVIIIIIITSSPLSLSWILNHYCPNHSKS